MPNYAVFREGSSWRYTLNNVVSPERFDSRDEALFAAELAAVADLKSKSKKKESKVTKDPHNLLPEKELFQPEKEPDVD